MGSSSRSSYRELRPPRALAPYVVCIWVHHLEGGDQIYRHPVLPDGSIDLVAVDDEVILAGPASHSTTLALAPGTLTVGVRFRIGAAAAALGIGAADLRDHNVAVDALWGRAGDRLAGAIAETDRWQDRLGHMVDELTGRLGSARPPDQVGVGVARLLTEHPGRSLAELSREVGLGDRQLRRRVEDAVGYSPRLLARILRFQHFLRMARDAGRERSLAQLAVEAGYADQAHLTRECRDLGGLPPAALLAWESDRLSG